MRKTDQLTRSLVICLIVLLPLLALALLGRSFIMDAVVIPIEYFFWLANLGVRAIPQSVFWAILCSAALLIVFFSLLSGSKEAPPAEKRIPARTACERVAFWALQLHLARNGDYSRLRFSGYFSKLILDILSYTGRISPADDEQALQTASLDLPPAALVFLKTRLTPIYALGPGKLSERLAQRWQELLRFFTGINRDTAGESFDEDVRQVVDYLENELEVDSHHDGH